MATEKSVNNDFYEHLGSKWLEGQDHPIALLRAEAKIKNQWVEHQLRKNLTEPMDPEGSRVLDVGCGAGFLAEHLAGFGYAVTGLDASKGAIAVAGGNRSKLPPEAQHRLQYVLGSGENLPFREENFSAVCCMDVLEHVKNPAALIKESLRVLKPGGLFFFHTFNRNFFSNAVVIYGVHYFFKNVPPNLHLYDWFIKPSELRQYCENESAQIVEMTGLRPRIQLRQAWQILRTGLVPIDFEFELCRSLMIGYMGVAQKSFPDASPKGVD